MEETIAMEVVEDTLEAAGDEELGRVVGVESGDWFLKYKAMFRLMVALRGPLSCWTANEEKNNNLLYQHRM